MEKPADHPERSAEPSPAQADGAPDDGVEDRLNVGLRPADDAENVACRGLLVERLGDLAVPLLQLAEQARVLDGDHRLVGEGLQKGDFLRGNPPGSARVTAMTPMPSPARTIGTCTRERNACARAHSRT